MEKRGILILFSIILATCWTVPARPDSKLAAHFTVHLIITANDSLKSIVENDMTRELKKLGDVEVTNDPSAAWLLYMNVTPIIDSTGVKGYVFSTVIVDQYSAHTIESLPKEDFKDANVAETVKQLTKNQVNLRDHMVDMCPTSGLQKTYSEIVVYFDENYLMPVREDISNFNLPQNPR